MKLIEIECDQPEEDAEIDEVCGPAKGSLGWQHGANLSNAGFELGSGVGGAGGMGDIGVANGDLNGVKALEVVEGPCKVPLVESRGKDAGLVGVEGGGEEDGAGLACNIDTATFRALWWFQNVHPNVHRPFLGNGG